MIMHLRIGALALLINLASGLLVADTIHELTKGETLYSIAKRYKVSVDILTVKNNISDPSALAVGMKLVIPNNVPTVTIKSSQSSETYYHKVNKGDTYYGIAVRYGLKVDDLLRLNRRTATQVLSIGEKLNVGLKTGAKLDSRSVIPHSVESQQVKSAPQYTYGNSIRVDGVPWWPVAGIKSPLRGKLQGISIKAEPLSYVHAVANGQVVWTGTYRGFGNVVLVDSNGYIFLYGGNDDIFVNVGQTIKTGNRIGRLASTGPGGDPGEMYFSVFRDGVPIAPEKAPRG